MWSEMVVAYHADWCCEKGFVILCPQEKMLRGWSPDSGDCEFNIGLVDLSRLAT